MRVFVGVCECEFVCVCVCLRVCVCMRVFGSEISAVELPLSVCKCLMV